MIISLTSGNSLTPDSMRKPLNPLTPDSINGIKSLVLPGIKPPQNPKSHHNLPGFFASFNLILKLVTLTVAGMAFKGISITVVTPPMIAD
ncbi:hypothetical protein WICPIJ_008897 [Wickerhamomyces pijperi]|uniref:Uncharacterized protein n=1 Tax=Wickerhamomyces pijperi TaxID=599730 RepID=A0A9P8PU77_WICPI|nr:hypothetical protein WICPIJ_008897 [Wickerhamomyces pijperi]